MEKIHFLTKMGVRTIVIEKIEGKIDKFERVTGNSVKMIEIFIKDEIKKKFQVYRRKIVKFEKIVENQCLRCQLQSFLLFSRILFHY